MKKFLGLLCLALLLCGCAFAASAAEDIAYFYVNSESGNDSANAESADRAVKTFTQACRYAERSGTDTACIVITNAYAFPATVKELVHTVPFVLTTRDEVTDFAATSGAKLVFGKNLRYMLSGETSFEHITIEYTGTLNCVAQYNPITFAYV